MKRTLLILAASLLMVVPAWTAENPNAWQAYGTVSQKAGNPTLPYFSPQMYDAQCGTANHECTAAINSAIDAANNSGNLQAEVILAPGSYYVNGATALHWGCISIHGTDPNGVTIVAGASFSGTYLADQNCSAGGFAHHYENITLDLRSAGASVTAFGSSSPHGAGGTALSRYNNIQILSNSTSTFAMSIVNGGSAEQWWITGTVWTNLQITAPCVINIAAGDDIVFNAARFKMNAGCTSSGPISLGTTDTVLNSTYLNVANLSSGTNAAIVALNQNVKLNGIFIEGSTNADWYFQEASSDAMVPEISRLETNSSTSSVSANAALIRVNVPTTSATGYGIKIDGYSINSGSLPVTTLFSIFNNQSGVVGPLNLWVEGKGYEQWGSNFAKMGSGGSSNANNIIYRYGEFNGTQGLYVATAPVAGGAPTFTWSAPPTASTWTAAQTVSISQSALTDWGASNASSNSAAAAGFQAANNTTTANFYLASSANSSHGVHAANEAGIENLGGPISLDSSSGTYYLASLGTGTNADFLCLSAAGQVLIQASACTISSLRFKHDWRGWGDTIGALWDIDRLQVGTFHLDTGRDNPDPNAHSLQVGLNAENVAKVVPLAAIYEADMKTPKSYRQESVIAILVRAVQVLTAWCALLTFGFVALWFRTRGLPTR